jgi:carbonic anhydrase
VIPYYRDSSEFLSTTSAIEYALLVLHVENIVVCGHSNCGGCKALFLDEAELNKIPHTKKWLELVSNAKLMAESLTKELDDKNDIEWLVEQENIVEQMNHLLSYPMVEERYRKGSLNIYGWYYVIETGTVYNYNSREKIFEKIE